MRKRHWYLASKRYLAWCCWALALALFAPGKVAADDFPSRPLRLICPFPPAGAVDLVSRAVASELNKFLGQTVVVENKPGAGGNVGAVEAARSRADGYTLFMTTSGILAINPVLNAKSGIDPAKDLSPVAPVASLNHILVVHSSFPATTIQQVIALAQAKPGHYTYASSGNGTTTHMTGAMFVQFTKTSIVHVPYKGGGPALTDLLAQQVDMMFDTVPASLPHVRSGKIRAVATTGARRDAAMPEVPTVAESGVPGFEAASWVGLMVPSGTPREVIRRLNAATLQTSKSPDFIKRMSDLGFTIVSGSTDEMAGMISADKARWAPVVRASGATMD